MIHPIRGGVVLGAVPVARVRRKQVGRARGIDGLSRLESAAGDEADVEGSSRHEDASGPYGKASAGVLTALMALRRGG